MAAVSVVPVAMGGHRGYGLGTTVAVAVVLALGLQVTYGLSGQLSVAHAPLMGVGAYATAQLTTAQGLGFWTALLPSVACAAAVGAVVGLPGLRVRGDVLALVTLGAGEILQRLYLQTTFFTNGYPGIAVPPVRLFGRALNERGLYGLALAVALACLWVFAALRASPLGRAWMADRDDEVAAQALGVHSGRIRVLAFAVGAGLAGVAGSLFAVQQGFVSSVSFGLDQTVTVLLVVLVAGPARLGRTVAVAVGLTALVDRLTGHAAVSQGVTGALILAVVALRLGLVGEAVARIRARLGMAAT